MPAWSWFVVGFPAGMLWMLFVVSLCRAAARLLKIEATAQELERWMPQLSLQHLHHQHRAALAEFREALAAPEVTGP